MDQRLGEYELRYDLGRQGDLCLFEAYHLSTNRVVLLSLLDPVMQTKEKVEQLLQQVRFQASLTDPFLGAVYSASVEEEKVYYTREYLQGTSLVSFLEENQVLGEQELFEFVGSIVRVCALFEGAGMMMSSLREDLFFYDTSRGWKMLPPILLGEKVADHFHLGIEFIGSLIQRFVPKDAKLRQAFFALERRVIANEISNWAEFELEWKKNWKEKGVDSVQPKTSQVKAKKGRKMGMLIASVLLLSISGAVVLSLFSTKQKLPDIPALQAVEIDLEGQVIWVEPYEVTIAEYAYFLQDLQHKEVANRSEYVPLFWEEVLHAVKTKSTFQGQLVTFQTPVFGVDHQDASAYAKWRGGRLAKEEEWLTISARVADDFSYPDSSKNSWQNVGANKWDQTLDRIFDLNSNVAEWSSTWRTSDFNPGLEVPVVCGSDFTLQQKSVHLVRVSYEADVQKLFIGFRVVYDEQPTAFPHDN